jgi:hypothetical protein
MCRTAQKAVYEIDAMEFFKLLTRPKFLEELEALLPEHRERRYPPTVTLAMFPGQVLSADGSCQNAVNEAVINRLLSGLAAQNAATNAYCMARQRLPQEIIQTLGYRVATAP